MSTRGLEVVSLGSWGAGDTATELVVLLRVRRREREREKSCCPPQTDRLENNKKEPVFTMGN